MKRVMVIGVALLVGATPALGAAKKTVGVGDNYYTPKSLTVSKGTTVTWKWPGFDQAGDVHDVKLKSAPKGVKKFHSSPGTAGFSYKKTLKKPGVYKFVCTLHEEMKMTIRVRG